jgi:cytochrome c oxidase subunit 2
MNHHALLPAGLHASAIAELFWIFVGVATAVYLIVIGFLVFALRRRDSANVRVALRTVGIGMAITSVVLVGLAVGDFFVGRTLAAVPKDPLRIRVTAHQWWWELEYVDAEPSRRLHTANELHVPVGRPVELEMTADDVIHSFWVPSLQGKKDLLPGYTTTLVFVAARAGRFEGQCAEFCGFQHAHMSVEVVAHDAREFERWYDAQLSPAAEPATPDAMRGREVFLASTCVMCHNISGTDASAVVGPDLTHIASRRQIGAGTVINEPAQLASWIRNPQALKPGAHMPATDLTGDDLAALTDYLSGLR